MRGQLYIFNNGGWQDAYNTYGLSLTGGAFAVLMTPAPLKTVITNDSRLEHGKRYVTNTPRLDERPLTLPCHIIATGYADLMAKLDRLTAILAKGEVKMRVTFDTGVTIQYRFIYQGFSSLSQAAGRLALIALKFIEPNPTDRS